MLALLGQYDKFDPAFLDVEDRVRQASLREDGLILVECRNSLSFAAPPEKRLKVKIVVRDLFQGFLHLNWMSGRPSSAFHKNVMSDGRHN